ncbi:hypothetical protein BJY21_000328 [Kineosphaera limosa]|uniref:Dodecin n=1 Tax=Kineosphaera limosa NBRC 100340 TaxID=1184609 RepID=K6WWL6_9MICO|nr:dodecin [Kineosphaera limosa]NYD99143.1 hypothetical protein [Kineosphaera limosa]GAB96497.1 hypothetical protein KILIM_040_00070 [Kineosphaera limosa NBRC 100340]
MSENVYSISEIVGTSKTSVDDAIKNGIERMAKRVQNLDWFEVTSIRGHLQDQSVEHIQVTMKVGFRYDEV